LAIDGLKIVLVLSILVIFSPSDAISFKTAKWSQWHVVTGSKEADFTFGLAPKWRIVN